MTSSMRAKDGCRQHLKRNNTLILTTQQLHIEEGTKQKDTSDNPMQESLKT